MDGYFSWLIIDHYAVATPAYGGDLDQITPVAQANLEWLPGCAADLDFPAAMAQPARAWRAPALAPQRAQPTLPRYSGQNGRAGRKPALSLERIGKCSIPANCGASSRFYINGSLRRNYDELL